MVFVTCFIDLQVNVTLRQLYYSTRISTRVSSSEDHGLRGRLSKSGTYDSQLEGGDTIPCRVRGRRRFLWTSHSFFPILSPLALNDLNGTNSTAVCKLDLLIRDRLYYDNLQSSLFTCIFVCSVAEVEIKLYTNPYLHNLELNLAIAKPPGFSISNYPLDLFLGISWSH